MNGVLLFAGAIFILWLGSSIFIPLLVATFFWYLINATATYYRKLFPTDKHQLLFKVISNILAFGTFIGLIYLFATRVRPMFSELLAVMPDIQAGLNSLWNYISNTFGNRELLPDPRKYQEAAQRFFENQKNTYPPTYTSVFQPYIGRRVGVFAKFS